MKASHDDVGIDRLGADNWREDVEDGLNGVEDGVKRALRFCVIESSIVPREMRRKSVYELVLVSATTGGSGGIIYTP